MDVEDEFKFIEEGESLHNKAYKDAKWIYDTYGRDAAHQYGRQYEKAVRSISVNTNKKRIPQSVVKDIFSQMLGGRLEKQEVISTALRLYNQDKEEEKCFTETDFKNSKYDRNYHVANLLFDFQEHEVLSDLLRRGNVDRKEFKSRRTVSEMMTYTKNAMTKYHSDLEKEASEKAARKQALESKLELAELKHQTGMIKESERKSLVVGAYKDAGYTQKETHEVSGITLPTVKRKWRNK